MTTDSPNNHESQGKIYLVPTPIGNLGDITQRAVEVLNESGIVACEDTRVTGRLFKHLNLKKRLVSYHDFNEESRAARLVDEVRSGQTIAVVTDAGSPGISDPAYRIVRAAIDSGLEVEALPGPTALIPALAASGLPTDRFFFEGFLPNKSAARQKRLRAISEFPHTLIFYESPHRVHKCLNDMLEVFGDRSACLAREISKKFETYIRGTVTAIIDSIADRRVKGEIVLVVAGNKPSKAEKTRRQK